MPEYDVNESSVLLLQICESSLSFIMMVPAQRGHHGPILSQLLPCACPLRHMSINIQKILVAHYKKVILFVTCRMALILRSNPVKVNGFLSKSGLPKTGIFLSLHKTDVHRRTADLCFFMRRPAYGNQLLTQQALGARMCQRHILYSFSEALL